MERTNLMATKLTPTEARQGTGPRAMFWVLWVSVTLAVMLRKRMKIPISWTFLAPLPAPNTQV